MMFDDDGFKPRRPIDSPRCVARMNNVAKEILRQSMTSLSSHMSSGAGALAPEGGATCAADGQWDVNSLELRADQPRLAGLIVAVVVVPTRRRGIVS